MGEALDSVAGTTHARRRRVAEYLGLERNVALASAAVFLLGFGEELWKKFLPKYLERLGEPSRKAMIVDFAREDLRARTVGLYYLVRSLTITPSAGCSGSSRPRCRSTPPGSSGSSAQSSSPPPSRSGTPVKKE